MAPREWAASAHAQQHVGPKRRASRQVLELVTLLKFATNNDNAPDMRAFKNRAAFKERGAKRKPYPREHRTKGRYS